MAKRFLSNRLNKHYQTGNFMDDIKAVKENVADNADRVAFAKLSSISGNTGTLIADELICPSSVATDTDPTSTAFTGVAMGGNGWTFNSVVWQFIAVASGVLQAGFNYLGQFIAGAGAVTIDADGIQIEASTSPNDVNSYKFTSGSTVLSRIAAYTDATDNYLEHIINSITGKNSYQLLVSDCPTGKGSGINLYAKHNGSTVGLISLLQSSGVSAMGITSNTLAVASATTLNSGSLDLDTVINGDSTTIATFDAGLEAVGFGGAAESGYVVKATGKIKSTGNVDATAGINVGSATGAGTGDVKGSGELIMEGTGASSVGGAFTVGVAGFNHVVKTTSESRQSDTALTADGALVVALSANKTYAVRGRVWFDTPAAADFKYSLIFGGTTFYYKHTSYPAGSSTGTTTISTTTSVSNSVLGTGTTAGFVEFDCMCVVDGSNRVFSFAWAQNTSTASNTTVRAGSYIEYCQMA